jgi:hypothetical protein
LKTKRTYICERRRAGGEGRALDEKEIGTTV